jgi:hypothetical protein
LLHAEGRQPALQLYRRLLRCDSVELRQRF